MQRIASGRRLAYYRTPASPEYWDEVWARQDVKQLYAAARRGDLGYYEEIFSKHLPKSGRILEAGCGQAQVVIALRVRGYDAEGVDYGAKTIEATKKLNPGLLVRVGDVTKLDVPDGVYQGYISLGVMEHLVEGPHAFLKEAHRILAQDGVALISVPYLNWLRWLKLKLGIFREMKQASLQFYQYAYSEREFDELLRSAGFAPIAHYQYGGFKGIKDEISFLGKLFDLPQLGWRLRKFLMNWRWANRHMGHMMMYVCRKRNDE